MSPVPAPSPTIGTCEEVYRDEFAAFSPEHQARTIEFDKVLTPQITIEQVPDLYEGTGVLEVTATSPARPTHRWFLS